MANGEGITPMVEKTVDIEIMDDVEIGAPNTTGLNIEELMSEVEMAVCWLTLIPEKKGWWMRVIFTAI